MSDDKGKLETKEGVGAPSAKAVREAKLARALRDNLRRRKGAPTRKAPEPAGDGDKD